MKIQNISNIGNELQLTLAKKDGSYFTIYLKRGQFVYVDTNNQPKSFYIQIRKGNIKSTEEDKPDNLAYFIAHSNTNTVFDNPVDEIKETDESTAEELLIADKQKPEATEQILSDNAVEKTTTNVEEFKNALTEYIQSIEQEILPVKNKGGRPKGAKNKSKRGRKKIKRPPGRPRIHKKEETDSNNNIIADNN